MSYVYSVTGNPVQPSEVMYRGFTIAADTELTWPFTNNDSADTTALTMDVTASTTSLTLIMPPADQASTGYAVIIHNAGSNTFTVSDNDGNTLVTIVSGVSKWVQIIDNTSAAGTWRTMTFGAGTSTANAADLAGYGLKAISTTLNENHPTSTISVDTNIGLSGRAQFYNWTGGAGTITFDSAVTLGDGFVTLIRNSGTGTLTLDPNGGQLINDETTFPIYPLESAFVVSDGIGLFTVGYALNQSFVVGAISIDVGGSTDVTLTIPQITNIVMEFTGVLTGDIFVNFPAVNNLYFLSNNTTGAFTVTCRPISGTGVVMPQMVPRILVCDTTTIYFAEGVGGGTVTAITAGAGLTGGTITTAGSIGLDVTGVAAATYTVPTIAVNAQGQITAASNGSVPSSSITGVVDATHGGTGIANNIASTITVSGAYAQTQVLTGPTTLQYPTSGTLLSTTQSATLSSGYAQTDYNAGTQSSGTFTPNPSSGNIARVVNGGAFAFAPPAVITTMVVEMLNNASAGVITTSGFSKVVGSVFTTTSGNAFHCYVTKTQNYSSLNVVALQ